MTDQIQETSPQIQIILDTDDYIVINKPPNVPVDGNHLFTVEKLVPQPHKLVHQLDSPTSGILLLAKTKKAAAAAAKEFQQRKTAKFYLAVLHEEINQFQVDQPICDDINDFKKFKMTIGGDKQSETFIYSLFLDPDSGRQLVLLKPITGRRHQLRVHCKFAGSSILGDKTYGQINEGERLCLHSLYLKNNAINVGLFAKIQQDDQFFEQVNCEINWSLLQQLVEDWKQPSIDQLQDCISTKAQ
ncbi:Ribosomal large subunit pseudouridine synthase D [Spironucleus salmonicida]|uniref:Ribosomal large subunit pseudouridine synthase D n=1 Tax=Spironucleus salmonicida TaxID=348837 RepID=V6LVK6_9EUKA|nr:Ribosomal large subunit pseudouridine synthase D [Spironucleus salmonicida]|eukprot:EST48273.1 Ribosomal large subunit pseudouridine synthase D [Spironucleus salmonicida]